MSTSETRRRPRFFCRYSKLLLLTLPLSHHRLSLVSPINTPQGPPPTRPSRSFWIFPSTSPHHTNFSSYLSLFKPQLVKSVPVAMATELVVETEREEQSYMKGVRHLCDGGVTRVPTRYILPVSDRPSPKGKGSSPAGEPKLELPVVDLCELGRSSSRPRALRSLAKACQEHGFFQVVNHGVPGEVLRSMVDVSRRFFELPFEERARHMSPDIFAPVRYGTSFNQSTDGVFCWRDFLKLSCHPLPGVLPHWPSSPPDLRQVAASYAKQTRKLFLVLMGAILESLGVDGGPVMEELRDGTQMMVVNFFPACPEPELTLGMPPHSDYGFLTLVLQDGVRGLQIQHDSAWVTVEAAADSLVVNVGDHLEIFSNGKYKSVLHRVLVNSAQPRISVATLHSLPAASVVRPSPRLVDGDNPRRYMDTDFAAFLAHLSSRETKGKSFLESRKLHHPHPPPPRRQ